MHLALASGRWNERFVKIREARKQQGHPATTGLTWEVVDLRSSDWIEALAPADVVVLRSPFLGFEFAGYLKERIYFIERFLGKRVMPSFDTVWHYDSKIAESYLLTFADAPTPRTFVSFSKDDTAEFVEQARLPLVAKRSSGAASRNVWRLSDKRATMRYVRSRFWFEDYERLRRAHPNRVARVLAGLGRPAFYRKVRQRLLGGWPWGVAYLQEYLPDNPADLRVTVIGESVAVAFWRRNRPDDFRASGSGLIDYDAPIPLEAVELCLDLGRRFGFDSMAYDLLDSESGWKIVEMSYKYVAEPVARAPGRFQRLPSGEIEYQSGSLRPEQLWLDWILRDQTSSVAQPSDRNLKAS